MRSAWGLMMPHQDWHTRAACTPDTADMFWLSGPATLSVDNRAALTICAGCPVRRQCLDHERDNPQMWSRIAGGVVWLNPRHGSGYAREADPATLAPATRPDPTPQPTPRPALPDPAPHEPVQPGRILRPHGTAAALARHRIRHERACRACLAWDADRKRRARAADQDDRAEGVA